MDLQKTARTILAVIGLIMGLAPVTGHATEEPPCADLELYQELEELIFIDHEPEGLQPGDQRILRWIVKDAEARPLGYFHVITTVLHSISGGDVIQATGTIAFANGNISTQIHTTLPDASRTDQSTLEAVDWSITGGTGEFAGATGTATTAPPTSDYNLADWTLTIDMTCPA